MITGYKKSGLINLSAFFFLWFHLFQPIAALAADDSTILFCDATADRALYDKYKFDAYKMLIPGDDGWIFRSESDLKTDFTLTKEGLDNLESLNNGFKQRGIELVIVIPPTRGLVHQNVLTPESRKKYNIEDIDAIWANYERSLETIRKKGIHVVGVKRPKQGESFFFKRDHHWNPDGAQITAKVVAEYVKKLPVYDDIEKIDYTTRDVEPYDFDGVSKKVFKKLCGTTQMPERIIRTVTEPTNDISSSNDLFGDVRNPGIVLLGTSNSTMEPSFSNFEGFLKQELSADILNMSVSGGGLDTAMVSYLNSKSFKETPAKIAIWEIPGYYDISTHYDFFREAIPAVYGSCAEKPLVQMTEKVIDDKIMIALDRLSEKKITGSKYYLNISFDSPVPEGFILDMRYQKSRDRYRFQGVNRDPPDGKFYVSLKNDKKDYLDKVILNAGPELIGKKVSISLCERGKHANFTNTASKSLEPKPDRSVKTLLTKVRHALKY